jgi:tetratricopeptide (TPR) repeat protein
MSTLLQAALWSCLVVVILSAIICLLSLIKKVEVNPYYQKKLFISVLLVMASLVFQFIKQGLKAQGTAQFSHGYFYGLAQQSAPELRDQLAVPALPANVEFFSDKRGPDGGQRSFSLSWILKSDGSWDALPFVFEREYAVAQPPLPQQGDSATLPGDGNAVVRSPLPTTGKFEKRFLLHLKALGADTATGLSIRYQPPADATQPGAFYIDGQKDPLPWEASVIPLRSEKDRRWEWALLPTAFAQSPPDCSKSQPSSEEAVELINQLGNPDLKTQLAAERRIISCGTCCLGFLQQTTKDPTSGLIRDRAILMANLAEILHQIKPDGPAWDGVFANFGMANYRAVRYADASDFLNRLSPAFLMANPMYYFYRAYADAQSGKAAAAIADYDAYLKSGPSAANRATAYNNMAIVYYRMGAAAESKNITEAAADYQKALDNFKKATDSGYAVPAQFQKSSADGLKRAGRP